MDISTPATNSHSQPRSKPRTRVMRSKAQWKALLEEFSKSGLTKSAFCKKHQIATSSLYRWQQLSAEHAGPTDFVDVTQPLSSTPVPPPVPSGDDDWQVELELGAGIVLRLRAT